MNLATTLRLQSASAIRRARGCRAAAATLGALTLCAATQASSVDMKGIDLKVVEHSGSYVIHGDFKTDTCLAIVWQVLTDYDHIGDFVSSLKRSTLEQGTQGMRVLLQDASAGRFPFRRTLHVALELQDENVGSIEFHDVLGKDFRTYHGAWHIAPDSTGTRVHYTLEAQPLTHMPQVFVRGSMGGSVQEFLAEVRAEMERRAPRCDADTLQR